MRCKICDSELSEIEEALRFCKRCGTKIERGGDDPEIKVNYYHVDIDRSGYGRKENKPKRKFAPQHLAVLSCLVLIFAAVGIFFTVRHNPEDDLINFHVLVEPSVDVGYISYFSEGLAVVSKGGYYPRYGYINMAGEIVIPCEYAHAAPFREGLAAVFRNSKWGFIDTAGEEVIPMEFDYASSFYDGLAHVKDGNKSGYINQSGEVVIPFIYDDAGDFIYDLAVVYKDEKWGLIDKSGNVAVPLEYRWIDYYAYNGFFIVYTGNKCGMVDKMGNAALPCIYDSINFDTGSGLIFVNLNGKWGIYEIEDYEPDPNINSWYRPWYGPFSPR